MNLAHIAMLLGVPAASGQSYVVLQPLPDTGNAGTYPNAVSADGRVAVGRTGSGPAKAVRWTASGVPQVLCNGEAFAVSADGSVVVGIGNNGTTDGAFVWSESRGLEFLAGGPGGSTVVSISGDGTVAFGYHEPGTMAKWVFDGTRWNETLFNVFLDLDGHALSGPTARLVSADGLRFVGQGGVQGSGLDFLFCYFDGAFAYPYSFAGLPTGISANGDVVVGQIWLGQWMPARWTRGGSVTYAPTRFPNPPLGWIYACNADGSIAVGNGVNGAALWSDELGIVDLNTYLPARGVDLRGNTLAAATGISGDGRTLVGWTPVATTGWMVTLPCPPGRLPTVGPTSVTTCATGTASYLVTPSGVGPFTFQWQWRRAGQPQWINVTAGANTDGVASFQSVGGVLPQVDVTGYSEGGAPPGPTPRAEFRCVVINACGSATSNAATLAICYANCDCSSIPPTLNANDFSCFLLRFRAGDAFANCDGSSVVPVLNAGDFSCFLTRFRAGCP